MVTLESIGRWIEQMSGPLYEGTRATIEIVLGATFIATIAGTLLSLLLVGISRQRKLVLFSMPLRWIVSLVGSYPLILFAILLLPWSASLYGSVEGASNGQLLLTIWGVFFFAHQILSRVIVIEEEEALPIGVIKSIEQLLVALLAGSATLGLLKMGGLVAFVLDLSKPIVVEAVIVVAIIYLFFLILIKAFFGSTLAVLRHQLAKKMEKRSIEIDPEHSFKSQGLSQRESTDDTVEALPERESSKDPRRENLPNDLDYLIRNRRS